MSVRLCLCAGALVIAACSERGAVTFVLKAPTNPLLDPGHVPESVSEYDLRTMSGNIIGIASAVPSSDGHSDPLLPLGALRPDAAPEDVAVNALSGADLVGMARVRDVQIRSGQRVTYTAEMRKPLVFIGSAKPEETDPGNQLAAVQILDPTSARDLAQPTAAATAPLMVAGGMTAGAVTWDGRFLVAAQDTTLAVFDTGAGSNVAGALTLPFAPVRVVAAPRDRAVALLSPADGTDSTIALIGDVAGLTSAPANVKPTLVRLRGAIPRAAVFSADGSTLYVLTGEPSVDPCTAAAPLAGNWIIAVPVDGSGQVIYTLASFAGDLTLDPANGQLILADSAAGQLAALDLGGRAAGPVTPMKLLDGLTCPSAVRVVGDVAYVVTAAHDADVDNAFVLERYNLRTRQAAPLTIGAPSYEIRFSRGGMLAVTAQLFPTTLSAYEMTLAPDGSRIEISGRARYFSAGDKFSLFAGFTDNCSSTYDIIEYGRYEVDTRSGSAIYEPHSQIVLMRGADNLCVRCDISDPPNTGNVIVTASCRSHPGDRPAGLTAVFGP